MWEKILKQGVWNMRVKRGTLLLKQSFFTFYNCWYVIYSVGFVNIKFEGDFCEPVICRLSIIYFYGVLILSIVISSECSKTLCSSVLLRRNRGANLLVRWGWSAYWIFWQRALLFSLEWEIFHYQNWESGFAKFRLFF